MRFDRPRPRTRHASSMSPGIDLFLPTVAESSGPPWQVPFRIPPLSGVGSSWSWMPGVAEDTALRVTGFATNSLVAAGTAVAPRSAAWPDGVAATIALGIFALSPLAIGVEPDVSMIEYLRAGDLPRVRTRRTRVGANADPWRHLVSSPHWLLGYTVAALVKIRRLPPFWIVPFALLGFGIATTCSRDVARTRALAWVLVCHAPIFLSGSPGPDTPTW